jgi:hypothetical protein
MIMQAAILREGVIWTLPRPARHHHIIAAMNDVDGNKGVMLKAHGEQGFISDNGTFLDREAAAIHAQVAGQLDGKRLIAPPKLYSEDLW